MTHLTDWYPAVPPDFINLLSKSLRQSLEENKLDNVRLFFRADDIGVPGSRFFRLLELCMQYEVPLALAVVPAWITEARWESIVRVSHKKARLWCWHQHGWRHVNHEPYGKKQEFGPFRPKDKVTHDLDKGRIRLEKILRDDFFPLFTPPWNRCDERTLVHLKKKKYAAVSRFKKSKPASPGLPDIFVNVDLHTRKETQALAAWKNLLDDFTAAFKSGYCGVMLHHQRMSCAAFTFLELLFSFVVNSKHIHLSHLDQMTDVINISHNR